LPGTSNIQSLLLLMLQPSYVLLHTSCDRDCRSFWGKHCSISMETWMHCSCNWWTVNSEVLFQRLSVAI